MDIVQTTPGPLQAMRLNLTWAVPDSAQAGDTFTLKLPDALDSLTSGFDLLAPDGSVVAIAKVVKVVTFTLTDYADTHNDGPRAAFFWVRWSKSEATVTGPVHLDFTAGSETFHDTVTKTGTTGAPSRTAPHKNGFCTHIGTVTGTDALSWTLDSSSGPFTTAKFTDSLGPGQTYDCASVRFRLVTLDASGAITSRHTLPRPGSSPTAARPARSPRRSARPRRVRCCGSSTRPPSPTTAWRRTRTPPRSRSLTETRSSSTPLM